MDTKDSYLLANARTQYNKIKDTLDGEIVEGNGHGYFTKGKILIGTADPEMMKKYIEENDMVILGNRERIVHSDDFFRLMSPPGMHIVLNRRFILLHNSVRKRTSQIMLDSRRMACIIVLCKDMLISRGQSKVLFTNT